MIPAKLKEGDEVRIVSPAESMTMIAKDQQELSIHRLESLGLKVSYSKYIEDKPSILSSKIDNRISDLHDAFKDPHVKAILTTIGGYDSNQLLRYLDYELIAENPKILCGYSDITALANAIYHKTGLVTYSGPHFSTFGMKKGADYTIEYFKKALLDSDPFLIPQAEDWSDDPWFIDQENRHFHPNSGYLVIQEGEAQGRSIGGNLCTLNLLHGTEFMPSLEDSILFLEDDEMTIPETFDRDLQSLIHQPGFEKVKGLILGRFQSKSSITSSHLKEIISTKQELSHIPVIANASFGHTTPQFTFPIGGNTELKAHKNQTTLKINTH